ncbi:MAG: hypothetical protein OXF93_02205 [Acidobacteria bacterium]|nr:hypothetical protein [Acidobacteriota bacterium]
MSEFQPHGYGRPPATATTSVWLVIDNLPGEDDEQRQKLQRLIEDLTTAVNSTVRGSLDGYDGQRVRAGTAKTGKLRVFEEQA